MTPEPTEKTVAPDVETEPACTLTYKKVFALERERSLAADPFEGYEKLAVGEGMTEKEDFKKLAESLVGPSQPKAILLWNEESGEIYVQYGLLAGLLERQGYQQYEAGFKRYRAEYVDLLNQKPFKDLHRDYQQGWEVGRVEQFDEVSEPVPSEHPDHDPKLSEAVERSVRQVRLHGGTVTVGESGGDQDWLVTTSANANLLFHEFDPQQRWVAFRTHRSGTELEDLARRVGLNCRVYRNGANLIAHGYHGNFHDVWSDREQLLVPVGISIG